MKKANNHNYLYESGELSRNRSEKNIVFLHLPCLTYIAQQPNGLYCRFSTIVDTVTHYNMTKDDYIEVCKDRLGKKRGEEEANDILKNYLHPFNDVLEQFIPNNDSVEEFNIRLKEMGYMDEFNG